MTEHDIMDVLRGSPGDYTEAMLVSVHGATRGQLAKLVKAGKVRTEERTMAQPAGLVVRWYFANSEQALGLFRVSGRRRT